MFSRIKKSIREYKEVKHLAYHDALTGLLNRNWMIKNVKECNTGHIEGEHVNYVYFLDINNLHEINKRGHYIGDTYIKHIVQDIKIKLDPKDVLVRYGGDEFIVFTKTKKNLDSDLYTYGVSEVTFSLMRAIQDADENMCGRKYRNNL